MKNISFQKEKPEIEPLPIPPVEPKEPEIIPVPEKPAPKPDLPEKEPIREPEIKPPPEKTDHIKVISNADDGHYAYVVNRIILN